MACLRIDAACSCGWASKGFFRENAIDLNLRVVFGGPEIAAELDAGRLLMGELGTPPGLTAMANGARFRIIGSGVRRGLVLYFVARKQFSAFAELKRAQLGCLSKGSCSDWYMPRLLRHQGLDPDADVTIAALGQHYRRFSLCWLKETSTAP
jgi:ABC-type nitrate/sulfonate/bicarbonate transport system substrate-binding protein